MVPIAVCRIILPQIVLSAPTGGWSGACPDQNRRDEGIVMRPVAHVCPSHRRRPASMVPAPTAPIEKPHGRFARLAAFHSIYQSGSAKSVLEILLFSKPINACSASRAEPVR